MAKKKITKKKKTKKELQEEKRIQKKEQIKSENRILRNLFLGVGIIIILCIIVIFFINQAKNFEYEGVKFKIVKEGNLILYQTSIPVIYQGKEVPYNFYLRNDPRKLSKIPFEGDINLAEILVINSTEDFNCDGDGIIAVANLLNLYKISGIEVIKDDTAMCDPEGKYAFIQMQAGNETSIEKFGPACFNINIKNCEVLKALERLMIESFIEMNKLL